MALRLDGGCLVTSLDDLRTGDVLRGQAISMRVVDIDGRATVRNENADEALYILEQDTGIHLPRGAELLLEGRMTVISVEAGPSAGLCRPEGRHLHRVRLQDVPIQRTGERWYRELIQSDITQFVGSIPPGRAPDHFHLYEEVLCVLQGSGFVWAGETKAPIAPGSCVYLPRKQVHCV